MEVSALNCSADSFKQYLPSTATVTFASVVPANGTFTVSSGDVAYPTSPTNLGALCALEIKVQSSNASAYSFGLFLPNNWNKRFLYVSPQRCSISDHTDGDTALWVMAVS